MKSVCSFALRALTALEKPNRVGAQPGWATKDVANDSQEKASS